MCIPTAACQNDLALLVNGYDIDCHKCRSWSVLAAECNDMCRAYLLEDTAIDSQISLQVCMQDA